MITTYKQQLTDKKRTFSNNYGKLEMFFDTEINRFCLDFNGKIYKYKTFTGCNNNRVDLMVKHNLKETA